MTANALFTCDDMSNPWIDRQMNEVEATVHGSYLTATELRETKKRLESLVRVANELIKIREEEGPDEGN